MQGRARPASQLATGALAPAHKPKPAVGKLPSLIWPISAFSAKALRVLLPLPHVRSLPRRSTPCQIPARGKTCSSAVASTTRAALADAAASKAALTAASAAGNTSCLVGSDWAAYAGVPSFPLCTWKCQLCEGSAVAASAASVLHPSRTTRAGHRAPLDLAFTHLPGDRGTFDMACRRRPV
jgi:hypothetical protein